ncbi:putative WIYLD domain-containing protein [Medicago truncatula]|uniref:Putative WIYLD domain-containing protein n=1 Tax=Medicago truncatula TaxID=3880 RepID=A0A396JVX5_MEDTR|nr:putative WIYLD domain-containing protein [Medicago truncatula]
MAPRRRPLKKGDSRMDAALDAMTPLGFDKKLIHQTVNKLLKIYDGNEGWHFIEDGAYCLLIDQLLEAQQDQVTHFVFAYPRSNSHNLCYIIKAIIILFKHVLILNLMICGYLTGGIVVRPGP